VRVRIVIFFAGIAIKKYELRKATRDYKDRVRGVREVLRERRGEEEGEAARYGCKYKRAGGVIRLSVAIAASDDSKCDFKGTGRLGTGRLKMRALMHREICSVDL